MLNKLKITERSVHITHAWIEHETDKLVLLGLDMREKYAQPGMLSDAQVYMYPVLANHDVDSTQQPTIVELVDLPEGWRIAHAWASRYTLQILLAVPRAEDREPIWFAAEGT